MSDYEKLHARIAQLVERNTGLADLANERGYEIDALKAENESLRQQLEARHPFKPAMDEVTIGYTGCLICGKYTDHGGLQCPKMRAYAISSPENPC